MLIKGVIAFLLFHFIGMIIFIATIDHMGCRLPWLEQPDWCIMTKAGAGFWEANIIYQIIYWFIGLFL